MAKSWKGRGNKLGIIKSPTMYKAWAKEHDYCQCCGRDFYRAQADFWPGLSTHHMVKPGRTDERCNLLRLCCRCHELAEGIGRTVEPGVYIAKLTLGQCLWLKSKLEPEDMNLPRLAFVFGRNLPDLEPPHEFFLREFAMFRPQDAHKLEISLAG